MPTERVWEEQGENLFFKTLNSQGVCTEKHPVQDGSLEREPQGIPALSRSTATCRPVSAARLLRERQTGEVGDHGFGGFSNLEASSYHPSFPTSLHLPEHGAPQELTFKIDTGVCPAGKGEGLAVDVIFIKKKLFHKPHCCVIAKWAMKGTGSIPSFNRKHMKN